MIQLLGWDIGNSVSEIIQGGSSLILAICAVVGGGLGWRKWADEKVLKKSKAIDALLEKFNNNELRKRVCTIDSSGGASELIKSAMSETGEGDRLKVEDSLMFVALLCQLSFNGVIPEDEFVLFKDSIMKILDDDDVKNYIRQAVSDSGLEPEDTHYATLLKFARGKGIDIDVSEPNTSTMSRNDAENEVSIKQDVELSVKQGVNKTDVLCLTKPISECEFDEPTAIIKINRKYLEGMRDDEILDAVSKWWRLRMDIAQKVSLVLAVANGYVKGVYRVQKWIAAESPNEAGRIGFIGKSADELTCKKFMGRSTSALFSRGAANPVRYFNVK